MYKYPIGSKFIKVIDGIEIVVTIHKIHKFEDSDIVYYGCSIKCDEGGGWWDAVWYEDSDLEMCKDVKVNYLN